jgi:hypothetical protein
MNTFVKYFSHLRVSNVEVAQWRWWSTTDFLACEEEINIKDASKE